MSLRTSFQKLIRRDPAASLRERAAATAARVEAFKTALVAPATVPPSDLARACDQAAIGWNAIQPTSQAEKWGDEQLDEALSVYDAVFQRALDEPSRDVAEVQAKARLLLHDLIAHTTGHDPSDETTLTLDDRLTRVVLREIINLPGDIEASDDGHAVTLEEMATLDFAAYTFDTPTNDPNGWMEQFSHHAIGMHIADRTLRMGKPELVAFIQKGGERDADTPAIMFKALDAAQETFEGWGKLLSLARTRYMVAASSAVQDQESAAAEAAEREPQPKMPPDDERAADFSLVSMIDLASASIEELRALHDVADLIGDVAYAVTWQGRCKARGGGGVNVAGNFVQWLGDAVSDVQTAASDEILRRTPANNSDRERRLSVWAASVIDNSDPDAIEAFARELLAHVEAEREGH